MYKVLSNNGLLGLVSDQDAKSKGVFVDFFGTPASTPKGAALFHINTKAPLLLGVCFKENFKKYLKWADVVVWMAALVGDGACSINPQITFDINSESVKFLAKNFKKKII